jgi:lipid A oxidase
MAGTAALVAGSCLAAVSETKPQEVKRKAEWVLVPYVGQSDTAASSLTISQPSTNTRLKYDKVHWDEEPYKGPIYYGFKAVYWPSPTATIGYNFDFIHYKVYADVDRTTRVTGTLNGNPYNQTETIRNTLNRFSISHGVNLMTLGVVARKPMQISERFPSGRLQPYGGVGLGIVINHPENRINDGFFFEKYQWGGFGWQIYLGAEYRVNSKWGVFAEYKYTDYEPTVDMALGGSGTTRLRTNHLAFGTSYRL